MRLTPAVLAVAAGALFAGSGAPSEPPAGEGPPPASTLSVLGADGWITWWNARSAPVRWSGPDDRVARAISWRRVHDGVQWSELRLRAPGTGRRVLVVVTRLDPARVRFRLETAWNPEGRPEWSVSRPAADAVVGLNAGQFPRTHPWGWVMIGGRERQPPGYGPLSVGVAFDSAGALRWISAASLGDPAERRGVLEGFQSFPRLLDEGTIPEALRQDGSGVDLRHRDARLAFGQTAGGAILIALTRFDGAGGALDFVPFGLTTPEMAAVMGALGARNAVLLDGGISSQLLIRDGATARRWRGLRNVPMGLVATARKENTHAGIH